MRRRDQQLQEAADNRRLAYVASKAYAALARGELLQSGSEWYEVVNTATSHILDLVEKQYRKDFDAGKRLHPFWVRSPSMSSMQKNLRYTCRAVALDECVHRQADIDRTHREMTEEDKGYRRVAFQTLAQPLSWNDGKRTLSFGEFVDLFPVDQRPRFYDPSLRHLDVVEDMYAYWQYLTWCFNSEQREDTYEQRVRYADAFFDVYYDIINQYTSPDQDPPGFRPQPFKPGLFEPLSFPEWSATRVQAFKVAMEDVARRGSHRAALFWCDIITDYRIYLLDTACATSLSSYDRWIASITNESRASLVSLCEIPHIQAAYDDDAAYSIERLMEIMEDERS